MEADDLIQKLQTDYLEVTPDVAKRNLSGHSNLVQMSFVDTHFPLEFIQNADDERAGSIRFQIREIDGDWCLEILNDGREFTDPDVNTEMDENEVKKDVRGLCGAGQSPKSPRNHIGFMGVGFKSIFEISNHVEIHSGEFDFEFNRERAQHQGDDTPWRIIPFDSPPTPETEVPTTIDGTDYKTRFVIHLNEERKEFLHEPNESVEENTDLFDPLDSSNLDRRVFLFLKNLQEISIHDEYSNTYRHMQRNQPTLETGPLADAISKARETFPQDEQLSNSEVDDEDWNAIDIVDISEQPADEEEWEEDRWTVFKHLWKVPSEVSEDEKTENYMRSDVEHREVFIAGLVDDDGSFRRPEDPEGTVHTGVFSYLPLKELETDFNFLVHADFLTPPDRQNIKGELLWNQEIAQVVVDCLTDVLEMLAKHDDWWVELDVFTPGAQGDEFIEENLIEPVRKYLRTNPLTRDTDGEFVQLDDCRLVSDKIREGFSADEVEQAGSSKAIHSSHEDVYEAVFPRADTLTMKDLFLNHDPSGVLEKDNSPAERLETIYEALDDELNFYHFQDSTDVLSETGVLLDDGNVIGTDDVDNLYFPPDELDISEFDATPDPLCAIDEQLDIVDRTLASDHKSHKILEHVAEAETLTTARVITQWLGKTDWSNISNSDGLLTARLYCETHNDGGVEEDDISLRLKTTSGEWERPEKLFMPAQYQPDDPVQKLQEFDWINEETVRKYWNNQEGAAILDGGPKFVSDEYLSLSESLRAKEWRELFYQLGVDKPLHDGEVDRNLIGCLGELYVHSQLGESSETNIENVHVGRDIVEKEIEEGSRVLSPKRIIEVKSTKDADKNFELSASQTKVLEKYDDKYFIYRVTEVLEEPQIHVASANDVDAVAEKKFTLKSAAWQSISTPYEDHT